MRKLKGLWATGLLCLLLACLTIGVNAKELQFSNFYAYAEADNTATRINATVVGDTTYLILPGGKTASQVPLYFSLTDPDAAVSAAGTSSATGLQSGQALDLPALCGGTRTQYTITLRAKSGSDTAVQKIVFQTTEGVSALFLTSDDPVNQGRAWVEASEDKSNKATGSMILLDETGSTVNAGKLKQIKGRGNSTWKGAKKPYQIKLDKKADLLSSGDAANSNKTWVLLANYFDPSLLRNSLAFDLAGAMQMDPALQYRPVSLYYDGEYRGAYQLSEKVEIASGRVDITDLEKLNEEANAAIDDLATLPLAQATTANGATYRYTTGMQSPADITGGYLLEMDFATRAQAELCYFVTKRGYYVVVKRPECCSQAEMDYIASYYQTYEDILFTGQPQNGKTLQDYIDLTSAAQCYIINELSKNPDGFHTSSYLYKETGDGPMHMGPIWDYDLSFGTGTGANTAVCADPEGFFVLYDPYVRALYQNGDFRMAVQQEYTQKTAPLISNVLCGASGSTSGSLQSFADYLRQLAPSVAANELIWNGDTYYTAQHPGGKSWETQTTFLQNYLQKRNAWLQDAYAKWSKDEYEPLDSYVDVPEGAWYHDAVETVTAYGLMSGQGNGVFCPEGKTTRAQTAQVLYAMSGAARPDITQIFPDVSPAAWYAPCVQWAYSNQVVSGYPDGTFQPDRSITRQDMIALLYRNAGSPAVSAQLAGRFRDSASISSYARNAMDWAVENKLISGYTDGTVLPLNPITRAEFATVMQHYYELMR